MAYSKTTWQNNVTDIDENNLNKIEQGIYDNSLVVDAVTNTLNPTDTETYKTAELTEGQITDVIGVSDIVIKGQTSQNGTPTPSAPVDVNVVSGSNVIRTADRNLLNVKENASHGLTSTINPDRSITYKGTIDTTWSNITQASGSSLTAGTYTFSINKTLPYQIRLRGVYQDATYSEANITVGKTSANVTFTQNVVSYYIYIISVTNGTTINETLKAQLEQGLTATTYTNQGKELPLDLGSIELCKIGNYQDYFYKSGSKWYLHKEMGKVVLDGNASLSEQSQSGFYTYSYVNNKIRNDSSLANSLILFSNYFKAIIFNNRNTEVDETIYSVCNGYSGQNSIQFNTKTFTSLSNFKTWLASNNVTVYYILETSTNTEITDTTLISQLEAIYNAPLYEETNITQENNDLPMVLDITACKDNINGIKAFIRK